MTLLIHDVTVFTNDEANTVLTDQAVAVTGNEIMALGPSRSLRDAYPGADRLDGQGRLLMPGLVNAHMHFYGTLARGLALRQMPHNFHEILRYLWWALDSALDLDAVYYSAILPAIAGIRAGVTSVIDHHASPQAVDGSLDRIETALQQVGLRGILCYEVSDRDGKTVRDHGLRENERYIRRCRAARAEAPDHPFDGLVGLHASFTLDDDSLEKAAALSQALERGCHIHLLEDRVDALETERLYHRPVVPRLDHFGILGPGTIAAHGIFLEQRDVDLLADSATIVTHQAQSNMNNAVGRADVFRLLDNGVTVGLGTDGMTADMRAEIRAGFLLHKHHLGDPNAGWVQFATMALKHNPAIFRRLSGRKVGQVAPGYLADLILVDYYPPTPLTGDNFWGHFLFGLVDAPVDTTIVDGRVVMRHKELSHIDEPALAAEAQACAGRVWQRYYNR